VGRSGAVQIRQRGADVTITELAHGIEVDGDDNAAVGCELPVTNSTAEVVEGDPAGSRGLVRLDTATS
jgi:hypothetical protein